MRVLAIDTALEACSVAVFDTAHADARAQETLPMQRGHAEILMPLIARMLDRAELEAADLDRIAVTTGPGSFTGLRVGIAAAQGLAFGTSRPIVGISALDALGVAGLEGREGSTVVGVWMEAGRGEVFAARYLVAPEDLFGVRSAGEAIAALPEEVALAWATGGPAVSNWIGDGVVRYREAIPSVDAVAPTPLLAPLVARLGTLAAAAGKAGAPHALRPVYVRPADVELARDRKARG